MRQKMVPMIHVPDVRTTVDWYRAIGFTVTRTYDNGGDGLSFAILSFGSSELMFNQGGRASTSDRREVDLYIYTDNVDDLYRRLEDRVEIVEGPHNTFYGMREFIIRDLNRFWITFGQASVFDMLMTGVWEGNVEVVRGLLDGGGLKTETLTCALAIALSSDNTNAEEIAKILETAGAVPPPEIDGETLRSYTGKYKSDQGLEVDISIKDGTLVAAPEGQQQLSLIATHKTTFRPTAFEDVTITFQIESGKTVGFDFTHGPNNIGMKCVKETKQP